MFFWLWTLCFVVALLAIYGFWKRLWDPEKFEEHLGYYDSDRLKGKPKKWHTKISRHAYIFADVWWTARWALADNLDYLIKNFGFGILAFCTASIGLIPFLELDLPAHEAFIASANFLLPSAIDALTFDIFSNFLFSMERPFEKTEPRVIIFTYYAISALFLFQAVVFTLSNIWTMIIALIFPIPASRLAREKINDKEPGTRFRRFLDLITRL